MSLLLFASLGISPVSSAILFLARNSLLVSLQPLSYWHSVDPQQDRAELCGI